METNCSVIAKVKEFNNEKFHIPGQKDKATFNKDHGQMCMFEALYTNVYANGENSKSKGYVSILIKIIPEFPFLYSEDFDFICYVSVIDAGKSKRFPRTFSFKFDTSDVRKKYVVFHISRYIARSTLLYESSCLLPNNCLTLHIDMILQTFNPACNHLFELWVDIKSCIKEEKLPDGKVYHLNLDSAVGQRIYESSTVFKNKLHVTNESTVSEINKPKVFQAFRKMCLIIMEAKYLTFDTKKEMCRVYQLAYKYDIQIVVQICRKLIKSYLCRKKADFVYRQTRMIKKAADVCQDKDLNEIISNILEENEAYLQYLSHLEWECRLGSRGPIKFSKKNSPPSVRDSFGPYKEDPIKKVQDVFFLDSNSPTGIRLCKLSSYFRDMLDLTSGNIMDIPFSAQELHAFRVVFRMITGPRNLRFRSVKEICQVYKLADKYDIQSIFLTCRELLKSCIIRKKAGFKEAEKIVKALDKCDIQYVKEIAKCIKEENYTYFHDIRNQEWECEVSKSGRIQFSFTPKTTQREFNFYA